MADAQTPSPATPRQIADRYVHGVARLNPLVATALGLLPGDDRMPDLSPAGQQELDGLARATIAELDRAEVSDDLERRCARLLRERIGADLAASDAGEHLRDVRNIAGPVQSVRQIFTIMPTATDDDWTVVARRLARVPEAYRSYVAALEAGTAHGLYAAPRQVATVVGQLTEWLGDGRSWFADFADAGPEQLRGELDAGAAKAAEAVAGLRDYLTEQYAPRTEGTPDAVGRDRYRIGARASTGADLDFDEAYAWGWDEYGRIDAEMQAEASRVLPGTTPLEAMRHLDREGEAVEGVEEIRVRLQQMMDTAIADLDGTHFDLADPVKVVEAMIAPPGSAAAPYYTRPTVDFSRPGRTWLPTLGETRFPLWGLVSTWYHEGVPGHHLQLAQWVHVAPQLSLFQVSLGSVSANTEGWALYAERLMDELGYLDDAGARLGYLDAQMMRAVRVIIDIGMHLQLAIPDHSSFHPGEQWTPELAREFFGLHSGRDAAFLDSEIVRYLGWPGQAISYKLGERAWLAGREAARGTHGSGFDPKAWHMAALSLGSLGLDDLTAELARL
ncbi:MAG: DUF885 domain-containing protein [Jiangellaceae bacterium]